MTLDQASMQMAVKISKQTSKSASISPKYLTIYLNVHKFNKLCRPH